jgi:putative helicase MOV10L1/helicase MOV-10
MHQPSQHPPVVARPTKSKAVPIINPGSGERQPVPVVHNQPTGTFPASLHPTTKGSSTRFTPSMLIDAKIPPISSRKLEDPDSDGITNIRQAFDVYARPFVPEALTIINTLHGPQIDTPANNQVDFGTYVRNSISLNFLPLIPQAVELPMTANFHLTDYDIHTQYEQHFRYHLEAEIQSQQRENESYSLYGHDVATSFAEPGQPATCSFLVPGLRENSPYVEEGDIVQLRQLRYDHMGRPFGMEQWLAPGSQFGGIAPGFPAPTGRWRGEPAPGWMGVIYNARASAVQRKQEQLVVTVCGLTAQNMHHLLSGKHPLKFNVQFPVPMQRYLPMRQVLPIIQNALCHGKHVAAKPAHTTSFTPMPCNPPQLEALSQAHRWLQSMLFPTEANCEEQTALNPRSFSRPFFDKQLNREQQKAIESICSQNYGTLPFLIDGPPGSGKTKTSVEAALQLLRNVDKVTHILFCAPSDPAADTIVQRLSANLKPAEMLRLNRPSRTFAEVPATTLPFCYSSQNIFNLPPFKVLMSYRLVVTTCRDASLLLYSRMTNSDLYAAEYGLRSSIHPYSAETSPVELHWTALLIDESAQAMEPEVLIPLSVVAPPPESVKLACKPLFVMAGDERQLGPRTSLRSSPLKISLFARLFGRPVYAGHPLARGKAGKAPLALNKAMLPILRPAFANLIRNYRSHPAILAIPSALFYADTLEPEATGTDRLALWPEWRGRQWPVLLCNNPSEDDLETDGGGWYNVGEAQIACSYASRLVQTGLVEQNEICIMSPFKAQVQLLRKTIREQRYGSLWEVDIGPTEAFQGLERGVVILCITRSKLRFLNNDKGLNWGIIGMPNLMNVALTRAKFGLIVIGKAEILLQDPNWKAFLGFCERNGLVTDQAGGGGQLHDGGSFELTRLEKVLLARERDSGMSEDFPMLNGVSQDDEMWTSGMQTALDMESMDRYSRNDEKEDE